MTDRPIIFAAPMVRALFDARKTQTRRLATSPLKRCEVRDRLWVREAWSHTGDGVFEISQARMLGRGGVIYRADENPEFPHAKFWPSLHMPREFSRLTLIVEDVRVEPLQMISEADAIAEGVIEYEPTHEDPAEFAYVDGGDIWNHACSAYRALWRSLHDKPDQRWDDNPDVLVLTFRVERGNIDQVRP